MFTSTFFSFFYPSPPHLHLSHKRGSRWAPQMTSQPVSFIFSVFSTALWDLANSRPVPFLMSSHLFFCWPCLLSSFNAPYKMVLARPDERKTCPYHLSLRLFTKVRRSSCGPIACGILVQIYEVTWSLY